MDSTLVEQRKEVRTELSWPVSVWLPGANRFFNGRSVNVSKGGAYLTIPLTAPVRPGQEVELNFPRTSQLAHQKGQYARIKAGKVVRVDRSRMMSEGVLGLAVQFLQD
ncbi:MAG TPA: PilZ domain-containing protein [Anaerohalosphaeraceae bacterium]|nr:PilZ domain-containing protein [Anaerohalosphaeraceae bacterium]HOL87735.1 PilZ domain-containing protein [Anaerohalosphaeraceae bacterium]HOQ03890.1 PilZ domain-containing protein [Anaerohalosphaeraceae bacterium]HPP55758.1 PilZ domain-containing protein [Anaerohalosphaeraceae bacterium]